MSGTALDPELLALFLPEWEAEAGRLAAAEEEAAQRRSLDSLRGLAAGAEIGSLRAALRALDPLPEPFDAKGTAGALLAHARTVAAAGHDLPFEAPPPESRAPAAGPVRVLVVDDSAMMRRLVRESLAADPAFTVVAEAADGREALARIAEDSPGLIMLDIEMPVLDGLGVLRDWALRGTGAVVVVSSAAVPGGEVATEARRLGASAVVGKPSGAFSPDLGERQGEAIRRAARRAAGLPPVEAP
ncbi:Response regulator receiver domain-containing protein [Roseomonas rosea]|uniref:Response regulator receiver domain-containing protein n=1 Tax=Muricoccus roseus TaxID=198092 RepID=A0A1M6M2L3_9PROT|nr:response regulator [Roseomonas rosea]SHJ77649.1 Response regulator receiver domain-containing protein [Roseomonas rosea]